MVIIKVDRAKFEKQLERALKAFAVEFSNKMADAAPFDEGKLQAEIRKGWKVEKSGSKWTVSFRMPKYAQYLERGTGIFGPFKRRIQPVSASVLAWQAGVKFRGKYGPTHEFGGSKNWYAFKSVKGIRPIPFITPTIHQHFVPLLRKNLRRFVK